MAAALVKGILVNSWQKKIFWLTTYLPNVIFRYIYIIALEESYEEFYAVSSIQSPGQNNIW